MLAANSDMPGVSLPLELTSWARSSHEPSIAATQGSVRQATKRQYGRTSMSYISSYFIYSLRKTTANLTESCVRTYFIASCEHLRNSKGSTPLPRPPSFACAATRTAYVRPTDSGRTTALLEGSLFAEGTRTAGRTAALRGATSISLSME